MKLNPIKENRKELLLEDISQKTLPSGWEESINEFEFSNFEIDLSNAVVKIESYYRSKFPRLIEYIYAFFCLLKTWIVGSNYKNITIGHFQIGILTSLKWTRTEINHVNYFRRLLLLIKFQNSVRMFRIGVHYFEKKIYKEEGNYIEQFAKFYNGTPTSNGARIKYSKALKILLKSKKNTNKRRKKVDKRFVHDIELDTSKMLERYNEIKGNIVSGEDLCMAVIICDKLEQKVRYTDFWGSNSNSLPVLQERRSVASTLKIALYACYLERFGNNLSKIFEDKRLSLKWRGEEIIPRNTDNKFRGEVTFQYAFSYSINTIAIQLINELGIDEFVSYLRMHGIHRPLPNTPLLALGALKLTGWELLSLLSPLMYEGHLVYLREREIDLFTPLNNGMKILSSNTVKNMWNLLYGVIENGTGSYLDNNFSYKLGGKTGTSEKNRDLWFIGTIDERYYGLIWLGMENEKEMITSDEKPISATRYTVPLWSDLLRGFLK